MEASQIGFAVLGDEMLPKCGKCCQSVAKVLPKCCQVVKVRLLMVLTVWRLCIVKICLLYKKKQAGRRCRWSACF